MSLGDFHSGCTIFDIFTTTDLSGRPTFIAGAPEPCLLVYRAAFGGPGGGCTTAGITFSRNCEGRAGVNGWSVNTNIDPAFYACGNQFQVMLSGGCVDSICVSGYIVARFSLNADSSLRPKVHGCNKVALDSTGRVEAHPCSAIFTVQKVIDRPIADSCSAIFSVQRVVDPDTILDKAIVQPTAIFTWPTTLRGIIAWLGAVASNKIVQEAGQQGVCTRDGSALISRAQTTDDGTSATRDAFL